MVVVGSGYHVDKFNNSSLLIPCELGEVMTPIREIFAIISVLSI